MKNKLPMMKLRHLYIVILFPLLSACAPEPPLHLYDEGDVEMDLPVVDLDLQVYWDYSMVYGVNYDWKAEWYYGWDDEDRELFGELGYVEPTIFNLRRYYTGDRPNQPHTSVRQSTVQGSHFRERYDWGYWDILCWNDIHTLDGIQSLIFDEETSLDYVTAYTNQTMHSSRYNAPKYTHSFYAPEPLFAAYEQGIEINRNLDGFVYNPEENVWVRTLNMELLPLTYIYLTQIILHNNHGRIVSTDGSGNLSGMARSTVLNTGRAGTDAITVAYTTRMKNDVPYVSYAQTTAGASTQDAERVDIIGGRLMTFGIPELDANRVSPRSEMVPDNHRHYLDINVQFQNGMDSTMVFDVTDQVRRRYKGGVLTIELDVDDIPIPQRPGGSGFDATVQEAEDGGTHVFDLTRRKRVLRKPE